MGRATEAVLSPQRLQELALRADRLQKACFTPFLTPPECEHARIAAKKQNVAVLFEGGYGEAERKMACFLPLDEEEPAFPITTLEICWPRQSAPTHRDLLGSVMGLGLQRHCIGDIVPGEERAYLFSEATVAEHILSNLIQAGRIHLQLSRVESLPEMGAAQGVQVRGTVATARLDAIVAEGFSLSRSVAADHITGGLVKLRHLPTLRPDARVQAGDAISVRGLGRLVLEEVGSPTRKGRLPVLILRFGAKK